MFNLSRSLPAASRPPSETGLSNSFYIQYSVFNIQYLFFLVLCQLCNLGFHDFPKLGKLAAIKEDGHAEKVHCSFDEARAFDPARRNPRLEGVIHEGAASAGSSQVRCRRS